MHQAPHRLELKRNDTSPQRSLHDVLGSVRKSKLVRHRIEKESSYQPPGTVETNQTPSHNIGSPGLGSRGGSMISGGVWDRKIGRVISSSRFDMRGDNLTTAAGYSAAQEAFNFGESQLNSVIEDSQL